MSEPSGWWVIKSDLEGWTLLVITTRQVKEE